MSISGIYITKADGTSALFSEKKLRTSLRNSGGDPNTIDRIVEEIEKELHSGMTTKVIYRRAFALLKKIHRPTAARYKLKKAIMELGPSGYPFEHFFGEIMKAMGYENVQVGLVLQGDYITHEVDVLAEKNNTRVVVECKYGNRPDKKVSSQVSLYFDSRFRDLSREWNKNPKYAAMKHEGWIATNTIFTGDATAYAKKAGLRLVSWDYPQNGSLRELIDDCKVYPVTVLMGLTLAEKSALLGKGIILCTALTDNPKLLNNLGMSKNRQTKLLKEIDGLCGS